jgi:hypothetical protein
MKSPHGRRIPFCDIRYLILVGRFIVISGFYVMKIPKTKTYSKPPTASKVMSESEVSEYPMQLALGF